MSLLKNIQLFIANNPGLTNKQLAASMPQFDVHAVQRGVCHLVKLKRATRKHNGKCYQYFAKPPSGEVGEVISRVKIDRSQSATDVEMDSVVNPAVAALMLKAQGLTEKGLFQRAATVLMEAFHKTKSEALREKILVERQRYLSQAKKQKAAKDTCFLAGNSLRSVG